MDAAEAFQRESGTGAGVDLLAIKERMEIRRAVQSGDIESAIEQVNDFNPEILEHREDVLFHLQQQRLIELIRRGAIDEAIQFAQEHLAPKGEDNPAFLEELERTVALLIFENPGASPMAELLDSSQRSKTASELNAAILAAQSRAAKPKLPNLMSFLTWAQHVLSEKIEFPVVQDLLAATPLQHSSTGGERPASGDVAMHDASDLNLDAFQIP